MSGSNFNYEHIAFTFWIITVSSSVELQFEQTIEQEMAIIYC